MKKERNSRYCTCKEYDTYSYTDTRYYGLWVHGQGEKLQVRLDPKRFQKVTYHTFSPEQLAVMNKRSSHYYHPPKPLYESYHCNEFCDTIMELRKKWENHFKPLIEIARERIPKPRDLTAGDCGLLMCGIMDPDEAQTWANFENLTNSTDYHSECVDIVVSLYAQFLHLFASQIEAVTVRVLSAEKAVTVPPWEKKKPWRNCPPSGITISSIASGISLNITVRPPLKSYTRDIPRRCFPVHIVRVI